jgi:hypothetical protein
LVLFSEFKSSASHGLHVANIQQKVLSRAGSKELVLSIEYFWHAHSAYLVTNLVYLLADAHGIVTVVELPFLWCCRMHNSFVCLEI